MDALMAALVLGAICQAGDKTPWLAAILADRYQKPGLVVLATALALFVNYTLGVIGGILIAPVLTPEVRLLLLALALLLAGVSTTFRAKSPDRLARWRLGAFGTSAIGLAIMVFGDRMQFVVVALAAGSDLPWLAAIGATIGALMVATPAALLGERQWLALPQRVIRIGTAAVLVLLAMNIGLGAAGLI